MAVECLLFELSGEPYAVPLAKLREVTVIGPITRVPFMPPHFMGVMNLRGEIVSVMDLRILMGLEVKNYMESVILVLETKPSLIGMLVDRVDHVVSLDVAPLPESVSAIQPELSVGVARWKDRPTLVLDTERVIALAIAPGGLHEAA